MDWRLCKLAETITIDSEESVALTEYQASFEKLVARRNETGYAVLIETAPLFRRLLNDRQIVTRRLNKELQASRDFQEGNKYSGQVLLLDVNEYYIVRANVWEPVRKYVSDVVSDDSVYSYLNVHDHNFSFMTGGYLGCGYNTTIWEWENGRVDSKIGDHAELRFLEHTSLPFGRIMVYRASLDVHRQEHAPEFSMSLNVLLRPRADGRKQYRFDLDKKHVSGCESMDVTRRQTLCDLAGYVSDDRTVTLLSDIADSHRDIAFRAASIRTLQALRVFSEAEAEDKLSRCDLQFVMPKGYLGSRT